MVSQVYNPVQGNEGSNRLSLQQYFMCHYTNYQINPLKMLIADMAASTSLMNKDIHYNVGDNRSSMTRSSEKMETQVGTNKRPFVMVMTEKGSNEINIRYSTPTVNEFVGFSATSQGIGVNDKYSIDIGGNYDTPHYNTRPAHLGDTSMRAKVGFVETSWEGAHEIKMAANDSMDKMTELDAISQRSAKEWWEFTYQAILTYLTGSNKPFADPIGLDSQFYNVKENTIKENPLRPPSWYRYAAGGTKDGVNKKGFDNTAVPAYRLASMLKDNDNTKGRFRFDVLDAVSIINTSLAHGRPNVSIPYTNGMTGNTGVSTHKGVVLLPGPVFQNLIGSADELNLSENMTPRTSALLSNQPTTASYLAETYGMPEGDLFNYDGYFLSTVSTWQEWKTDDIISLARNKKGDMGYAKFSALATGVEIAKDTEISADINSPTNVGVIPDGYTLYRLPILRPNALAVIHKNIRRVEQNYFNSSIMPLNHYTFTELNKFEPIYLKMSSSSHDEVRHYSTSSFFGMDKISHMLINRETNEMFLDDMGVYTVDVLLKTLI